MAYPEHFAYCIGKENIRHLLDEYQTLGILPASENTFTIVRWPHVYLSNEYDLADNTNAKLFLFGVDVYDNPCNLTYVLLTAPSFYEWCTLVATYGFDIAYDLFEPTKAEISN